MANVHADENHKFSKYIYKNQGYLFIEDIQLKTLQTELEAKIQALPSPVFVYSKAQLCDNVNEYKNAADELESKSMLGYAIKANPNYKILTLLKEMGCTGICVSGNELKLAIKVGFEPTKLVLNGNGKNLWEIELAVKVGALINIDSEDDYTRISQISGVLKLKSRVLLRVNPDIDPQVHPYIATGTKESKFGIDESSVQCIMTKIQQDVFVEVVGFHIHLGSTIDNVTIFRDVAEYLLKMCKNYKEQGFKNLQYINIGGGLGIDYTKHAQQTKPNNNINVEEKQEMPSPSDLIKSIKDILDSSKYTLILEPGRSMVGNTGLLLTKVIGVKKSNTCRKKFIVVDGSMTEVMRPCLYSAYHHIELTEPPHSESPHCEPPNGDTLGEHTEDVYYVVGPVCESADFLGKDRRLATPAKGSGLVVFDVGAYCSSMGSNYNMRCRPAEVLIDGAAWSIIRSPETFDDLLRPYLDVK
ncbi:unnamed protein product [Owenia fusiformis]|uniref:Uncharacterized protein n=1 Tax=Owenia fusiformis TaxID=6347 RepID=A0A8J1U517_OWEFU|nr:unnamed protein product [Owenia fusiformis]